MSKKIIGRNAVLKALQSGQVSILGVYLFKGADGLILDNIKKSAADQSIPVSFKSKEQMSAMAKGNDHQGVIAVTSENPIVGYRGINDRLYRFYQVLLLILLLLIIACLFYMKK